MQLLYSILFVAVSFIAAMPTIAQQHSHPAGEEATLHEEFYLSWKRKHIDLFPTVKGCCSGGDCYQTLAEYRQGQWFALRREDKKWIPIPERKVDYGASPNGRALLCNPDLTSPYFRDNFVWCFAPPGEGA